MKRLSEIAGAVVLSPLVIGILVTVFVEHRWQHGRWNPFNCDRCEPAALRAQDSGDRT